MVDSLLLQLLFVQLHYFDEIFFSVSCEYRQTATPSACQIVLMRILNESAMIHRFTHLLTALAKPF